ncbi:hypothetical protein MO973_18110 [Paenibacillus sp. TRM 82003]|uniref:hypothetical protein n=1 Tax=Kineococcus sp. TRM81007 TaxID=2925831 RepID=UPI001F5848FD|nr:hypothetical protein [Kineococcus sp. TRM81007]MCI2238343.1 hypothetical protein [Kineococcus sp. TRM81007]MCI3922145.1 hypothetical protein [Paenibacillus sp. TRM 82003]
MRTSKVALPCLLLPAALAVALGACGGPGGLTEELRASPLSLTAPNDADMEALMSGVLTQRDGCTGVQDGSVFHELVRHSDDVEWQSDSQQVVFQGQARTPGDTVWFGGGTTGRGLDHLTRPEGCADADGSWLVGSVEVPAPQQ